MADPQHWIAAKNIARFREQLAKETDTDRREVLKALLAQERARALNTGVAPDPE